MAEQPLNATISIFRQVRAYRQELRHEADKAITGKLRSLVMSVPSREVLVSQTRDAFMTDAHRYGHPVVRFPVASTSLATAINGITGLQFPIRIGRDVFLAKDQAHRTADLHANLRTAAGLTTLVVDGD
jgi:hypothetical protein